MSLKTFIKSRKFFIHIGISILLSVIIIWGTTLFLGAITQHGSEITVPDLTGLKIDELDDYLSNRDLEYEIIDSIFNLKERKGTVISQDPFPNSKVKSGRKIYVTVISKLPERTTVPDLKDLTLRQTIAVLQTYGLKVGKLEYVTDIARNAVLKQKYKGQIIEQGTMIEKGSLIDVVLGRGDKNEKTSIPYLLGKKRNEAIKLIQELSLNIGKEVFEDDVDTSNARVYKQFPNYSKKSNISLGSSVDIWYKSDKKFDFNTFLKNHKNDTISDENDESDEN